MKKKWFLLIWFLSVSGAWGASDTSTGAAWLDIPTDARASALAGAVGASSEGVNALGGNPAGFAETNGTELLLTHDFWVQDVTEEHVGIGQNIGEGFGLAAGFDYIDFGNIDTYSIGSGGAPVGQGTVNPYAMNLSGGCGLALFPGLDLGGTFKVLMENLTGQTTATALAGDAGLLWKVPGNFLRLGAALLNAGQDLDGAPLPVEWQVSGEGKVVLDKVKNDDRQVLLLLAQGDLMGWNGGISTYEIGSEYRYDHFLALRAGYRLAPYGNLTGITGLSAGVGIDLGEIEVSYAFVSDGDFGNSNQLSFQVGF